jgi:hypothetical protein
VQSAQCATGKPAEETAGIAKDFRIPSAKPIVGRWNQMAQQLLSSDLPVAASKLVAVCFIAPRLPRD